MRWFEIWCSTTCDYGPLPRFTSRPSKMVPSSLYHTPRGNQSSFPRPPVAPRRIAVRSQPVTRFRSVISRGQHEASARKRGRPARLGSSLCSGLPTYVARSAKLYRSTSDGMQITRFRRRLRWGARIIGQIQGKFAVLDFANDLPYQTASLERVAEIDGPATPQGGQRGAEPILSAFKAAECGRGTLDRRDGPNDRKSFPADERKSRGGRRRRWPA